tara:strand:+ start:3922 stop:6309 length:2388 start_codon:yes stop_codon:yes gene_type:complete
MFQSPLLKGSVFLSLSLSLAHGLVAQENDSVQTLTRIPQNEAQITLDGVLDEPAWQRVPIIDDMRVIQPDTLVPASLETHTKIFYNSRGLYVGVMNYQDPATLVARMSSRDSGVQRDGFVLSVDPSGEGLYGYFLRINLGGTFSDGTILPERQINRQWDGPWDAVTREVEEGWVAEYFIPWSMMSLPQSGETRRIGLYTERMVAGMAETWSWPALPNTGGTYLSGFQKYELSGVNPATQFTFYPYSSATFDDTKDETQYRVGADVYWRPSSNLQLSATLNPDFGTVESDDVVVNLGAFETFFEEKRSFFLEGQDVFNTSPRDGGGRGSPTTLLNTRRIGRQASYDVPSDVTVVPTDLSRPSDLLGALKLTGQSGNWRYGSLLAAEDDSTIAGTRDDGSRVHLEAQGRDFAIARLLYEDTSVGGRRSMGWFGSYLTHPDREAMVNGVDMHYFSADSRWEVDGQFVHSDVESVTGSGAYFDLDYRPSRGVQHTVTGTYFDDTVDLNDVGFLQRNDLMQLDYRFNVSESNVEGLRSRNRSIMINNQWNTAGRPVRLGIFGSQSLSFNNNASVFTQLRYFPERFEDRLSRGNGTFKIPQRWGLDLNWNSDRSRPLSLNVGVNAGQEDLGDTRMQYFGGVTWQPNDRFVADANLRYVNSDGWLIHQGNGRMTTFESSEWGPRLDMDYFINAKQQLRFSLQWTGIKAVENEFYQVNPNSVEKLINTGKTTTSPDDFNVSRMSFQARYRWEIAPLSDLFFVYSRGGNLARDFEDDHFGLFVSAWQEEVVDNWVLKLRYRLGS